MGKRLEQQPMYPHYTYYYPHYLQTKAELLTPSFYLRPRQLQVQVQGMRPTLPSALVFSLRLCPSPLFPPTPTSPALYAFHSPAPTTALHCMSLAKERDGGRSTDKSVGVGCCENREITLSGGLGVGRADPYSSVLVSALLLIASYASLENSEVPYGAFV
ncbi:unnamed protein product [Pleuronectes platessa]|uniref:Uncharacterized protein n=1 Tax=Pleuronectes platessa TaxID=8262 RepID=A0A9N7Y7W7_PLEPL|nr:unnamed protein product [Pleuronectes platessa]